MRDSSLSAIFGALSNEMRMSTIANNLANVNTTAYKKDTMAFHDVFTRFAHDHVVTTKSYLRDKDMFPRPDIMAKPRLSEQTIDFSQGSLQETGNQLDIALSGEGLFKVQSPSGMLYTRAGNFVVDSTGTLVTEQGTPVMVSGGSLTVPPGAKLSVDEGGNISVNGNPTGSFDLVTFDDIGRLERVGGNFYRAQEGAAEVVPPDDLVVQQGFIEKGNVEVVTEMVSMIETQRSFTMYTKMIQGTDQLDKTMIQSLSRITG
ncbi:flagellar basal-body rod protein FlgF [Pseudodesulfovibrio piezophilus]|uniref:Flagellar basal-body rod protein FlgF n=1 Tax=Pseudodesulfovibrio piezophilus (strain DSM 21447 / JCM 15486 / C1TLV30) TaxID=1322246 RepID=M1WP34_PSEP2|nr:flagellar basal-body rod protein FlgF [Pseudodesulfovibrio piezophilus]CCH47999.1 Flagellar basal-body rod protein FlgF [Pseudodesulfovibrio piezophilus C1TLV30]